MLFARGDAGGGKGLDHLADGMASDTHLVPFPVLHRVRVKACCLGKFSLRHAGECPRGLQVASVSHAACLSTTKSRTRFSAQGDRVSCRRTTAFDQCG